MTALFKRRFINASLYSLAGLRAAWRLEEAFRVEVVLALLFWPLAWVVGDTPTERALLIASTTLVLIVELLNTALEKTIDRISLEVNETSRIVKDIGSAAVALSMLQWLVVWLMVLMM